MRIIKATSNKFHLSVQNGHQDIFESHLEAPSALINHIATDYDKMNRLLIIFYDCEENLIHYLNYLQKTLPPECTFACTTEYTYHLSQIRKQLSSEIKTVKGLFSEIVDQDQFSSTQDSQDAKLSIPDRKSKKVKIDYIDFRRRLLQLEIKNDYAMSRLPDN